MSAEEPSKTFQDDQYCLCCGGKNPHGFKMNFRYEGEALVSETVIPKEFQGFADVVHGGILGTLLDEVMVNLYWRKGIHCVTVEYTVRLKAPCPTGRRVVLKAFPQGQKRHLHYASGEARLENGSLVAEATAKCMEIP